MSVVAVPEGCGIQINRKLFCADVHCPNAEQGVAELLYALTNLSSFPGMSHCFKGVIHGRGWKCCMEVQVGSPLLCPFSASDQHQTLSCPALELGSHLHGAPGTQPQLAGLRSSQVGCCGR